MVSQIKTYLRKPETFMFLAYILLLGAGLYCHELWSDEARPWLMVEEFRSLEFFKILRYESHPIGWYAILKFLYSIGLSVASMKCVNFLFAAGAFWILIYRSPFTRLQKILLVFNAYLLFQYGVHSRSYSLELLALFGLCSIYHARENHRLLWTILACVLCLSHPYGFFLTGFFLLRSGIDAVKGKSQLAFAIILAVFAVTAAFLVRPSDALNVTYSLSEIPFDRILMAFSFALQGVYLLVKSGADGWGKSIFSQSIVGNFSILLLLIPTFIFALNTWKKSRFAAVFFVMGALTFTGLMVINRYAGFGVNHLGQFSLLFLSTLWLRKDTGRWPILVPLIFQACSGMIMLTDDIRYPYSMGPEVAKYLEKNPDVSIVADPPYFSASYLIHSQAKIYASDGNTYRTVPSNKLLMTTFSIRQVSPLLPFSGIKLRSAGPFLKKQLEQVYSVSKNKVILITNYEIQDFLLPIFKLKRGPVFEGALVPLEDYFIYEYEP